MANTKIIKAALAVAKTGLPVFPTVDKKPCWSNAELGVEKGQGGYKIATTDPKEVERLFGHRDALEIAVPMGEMSGLICVDIDWYKAEKAGDAELKSLHAWYKKWEALFKATQVHDTRSGGEHIFFQHPGDEYRYPATLRKFVDLKANGTGYVCWPGTEGYAPANRCKPKAFPLMMLEEAMISKGGTGNLKKGSFNDATDEDLIAMIQDGSELYPAMRTLSYRLAGRSEYTRDDAVEILQGIMDASDAAAPSHSRHEDWADRYGKIEDLVDSAVEKRAGPQFTEKQLEAMQEGPPVMQEVVGNDRPIGPQRETKPEDIERRVAEIERRVAEHGEDGAYHTITLGALSTEELPPIEWIVQDMLPAGGMASLGGTSNVGKTRWLAALAACLNTGTTHTMGLPTCEQTSVLWIANEEHTDDIKRRIKAAYQYLELDPCVDHTITVRPKTAGTFRLVAINEIGTPEIDEENIAELVAVIRRTGSRIVFLDPYITLSDAMDENSAQSASILNKAFLLITSQTGACVLHAHHTPKDRSRDHDWYRGDSGAWRGSGAIYSSLDCGFTLSHWMPKDKANRKAWKDSYLKSKLNRFIVLDTGKIREGENLEPVLYELTNHELEDEGYGIGVCAVTDEDTAKNAVLHGNVDLQHARELADAMLGTLGFGTFSMNEAHKQMEGHALWPSSAKKMSDKAKEQLRGFYGDPFMLDGAQLTVLFNEKMKTDGRWAIKIEETNGNE